MSLKDVATGQNRIKELEKLVKHQEEVIENLRAKQFKLNLRSSKVKPDKDGYIRVIIPDSHGCSIDKQAAKTFLNDLSVLKPKHVIMLGDHLDCGGFLAQHHTLGYVAETEYNYEDDCAAANQFLDEIQKSCSHIEYLEGNHERRVEKWIITETLRNKKDSLALKKLYGPKTRLFIEQRGIHYYEQGVFYDKLRIPATIKRGPCYYTHGTYTTKHAAASHLNKFKANVVFGHTHRIDSSMIRTVKDGEIGAWSVGCLCTLQPYWAQQNLTDWCHGYGIQLISKNSFLHITIPIIEGRSYLDPLVKLLRL